MGVKTNTWLKFSILIALFGLCFSYAMFQGGFVSWFLFYSFLPFALYALFLALYPFSDFKVARTFDSDDYNAGDQLKMTVSIERSFPFPLFFLIIDHTSSLSTKSGKQVIFPGFKRNIKFNHIIGKLPRGEHHFDNIRIKIGDPIGLFEKETEFPLSKTILVYPAYTDVIYRAIESRYEQGATASQIKVQNDTTMVTGIRKYEPGDRFTWIDWKATARMNEMQTKDFEIRQSHDISIILDRTFTSTFELNVKLAASLVRTIIRHGGQVGLYSIGEDQSIFPIRGGDDYQYQIFHHLAKVRPDSPVEFSLILNGEGVFYQQSAALLIITSELSKPFIEVVQRHLRRTGKVVIFVVKNQDDQITEQEHLLSSLAVNYGLYVNFLYEEGFRSALLGVKQR